MCFRDAEEVNNYDQSELDKQSLCIELFNTQMTSLVTFPF